MRGEKILSLDNLLLYQVNGSPSIAPASLWSRPKVQEFIQHVRTDPGSVLVVGRGETITVRVPTHENGMSSKTVNVASQLS